MAENLDQPTQPTTPPQGQPGQQQIQVMVDQREARQIYANFYNFVQTEQEVIVDLGFSMPNPGSPQGQPQIMVKVTDRLVLSYVTAKRLMLSLQQLVKRFEQQFGEIPVTPGPRK